MDWDKTTLVLLLLYIFGLFGSLITLGITFFQAYILATYQVIPLVVQQVLVCAFLLLAGIEVTKLPCQEGIV